jgi:hypothetical protein
MTTGPGDWNLSLYPSWFTKFLGLKTVTGITDVNISDEWLQTPGPLFINFYFNY